MNRIIKISIFITLLSLTKIVSSTSVTYNFEASAQTFFLPPFVIEGPIQGSFQYDSGTSTSGTIDSGSVVAGASIYESAISGLMGSVNGNSFSDVSGAVITGNEVFDAENSSPLPGTDFLLLSFDDAAGPAQNLNGFSFSDTTLGELFLTNVRLFWIEGRNNVENFLSDNSLPDFLPTFAGGQLALDFEDVNGINRSFFYDLQASVAVVNAPSVTVLFMMSIVLIRLRSKY